MPTASGHTDAIRASRVIGTEVYNAAGDHIGSIEDVMLEKTSNGIMFAVIGFGGFLVSARNTTRFRGRRWTMTKRPAVMSCRIRRIS